jgi:hypothetical protein
MSALDVQPQSKPGKADKPRLTREQRIAMYLDVSAPAISGCGGHNQTFKVACALVNGFALDEELALAWLELYNRKCDPPWSKAELRHKIRSALGSVHNRPPGYLLGTEEMSRPAGCLVEPYPRVEHIEQTPPWPSIELDGIERVVSGGFGLYDLWEASPIRFEYDGRSESRSEEIVGTIFPDNPLLCCGWSRSRFATHRRLDWGQAFSQLALIVPNPMLEDGGYTQEGHWSSHCLEATAARVYQVVEFDFATLDRKGNPTQWTPLIEHWESVNTSIEDAEAALHFHLSQFRPLTCVTSSGGKSLHGWYNVFDLSESAQRGFMERAVSLGADRATWVRSQFVRMPDGLRENGRRQSCFYLNPKNCVRL